MSEKKDIVFCTGGGCTAKLGAGVLSRILEKLPRGEKDPNLLVGYDSRDDAAVYQVTEERPPDFDKGIGCWADLFGKPRRRSDKRADGQSGTVDDDAQ